MTTRRFSSLNLYQTRVFHFCLLLVQSRMTDFFLLPFLRGVGGDTGLLYFEWVVARAQPQYREREARIRKIWYLAYTSKE